MLLESHAVNAAVARNEGYCSYSGKSHRYTVVEIFEADAVTIYCEKSAEVIVPIFSKKLVRAEQS